MNTLLEVPPCHELRPVPCPKWCSTSSNSTEPGCARNTFTSFNGWLDKSPTVTNTATDQLSKSSWSATPTSAEQTSIIGGWAFAEQWRPRITCAEFWNSSTTGS